ncbi:TonB-dependent siderophore receptor [Acinetobacter sp. ANC 4558]|uniref:TonB-dependent siderophore receptor n=1 Tax=Acinetobacter sp. ANC 4558 TaxID=1977876 RepID=UPI000A34F7CA|nr:TonB-dependent siderophore receptor [Acinetobacter sp. ANC 4558]OTG86403.1 TonB-dependent siderophore receptor [Acinetobacter sp. ANC 4558]
MFPKKNTLSLAVGLSIFHFISSQVYAENVQSDLNHLEVLPTITVKAETNEQLQKKVESGVLGTKTILDTPFSITVIDKNDIDKRGAKSMSQIFSNDASFYSPTGASATDWWGATMRGLPVRNYFADDYPIALHWGGDFPLETVDSVTALKGLTGFMYGFGTPGGAISYQLKRPLNTPKTTANIEYRNSSLFSAMFDKSDVIDSIGLKYRAVVAGEKGTAYNDSDMQRYVGSLALEKDFTDTLHWEANIIYENSDLKKEPFTFMLGEDYITSSRGNLPKATYDYDHINIDNSYYKSNTTIASTALNWTVNDHLKAKYQFGYTQKNHKSNKSFVDLLSTNGDYDGYMFNFSSRMENYLNQLMLTGNMTTGFIEHELVGGVGNIKTLYKSGQESYWRKDFTGNLYQQQHFTVTRHPNFALAKDHSETNQTYSFLSDTLKFSQQWQAILGARYTYYDVEADTNNPKGYNTKAFTPTLAILYKPIENMTTYLSYVESLEEGGIVADTYANAGEVLDATVSKQYELGVKYELNNINLTSALFRIQRAGTIDTRSNNMKYLKQDGLDIYNGFELNANAKVTDDLKLGMGLIYLKAEKKKVSAESTDLEGKTPSAVPKWNIVVNTEYHIPEIDGLSIHANARYNGARYFDNENQLKAPAYTIFNFGMSYDFKLQGLDATINANINNLFNKKYWAVGGGGYFTVGEAINGALALNINW